MSSSQPTGSSTFLISVTGCALVAILGIVWPQSLQRSAAALTETTLRSLDWFYMATVSGLLVLSLWLAFSRFGKLRLGKDEDRPEFSTLSWMAMLFSAGMGAGLLFWSVAEPMTHFASPPTGEASTAAAAQQAMVIANFHWGLHAWAIYAMAALALAYFRFRHGTSFLPSAPIRWAFEGRWVAPLAKSADLLAVLAVAFGVAGAMGLGIMQLQTGLSLLIPVSGTSAWVSLGILAVLFASYMLSAATSLDKGIKWLSNINMLLAIVLLLFVLFAGPTAQLLRTFVTSVGDYATGVVSMALQLYPNQDLGGWQRSWTLTYLIWWIAWAPFVGVFVARISRGRTIREFVLGVLLAPTCFSMFWFAVFGGTAFEQERSGDGGIARLVLEDVTVALFAVFDQLPLSPLLTGLAVTLVFVFVVTSVDSATYVLSMMTSGGDMDPSRKLKLSWGTALALLGGALLWAGDPATVRAVAISGAIPFTFVLLIQVGAFMRALFLDQDAPTRGAE